MRRYLPNHRATRPRPSFLALMIVGVVGSAIGSLTTLVISPPADAGFTPVKSQHWTPGTWQQPYGGCDEAWQAPSSDGAQQCRDHGWTVNGHLVVNPHAVIVSERLPHCIYEDGSRHTPRCIWIGGVDGNGHGLTLWYDVHGNRHYVWPVNPIRYNIGPAIRWSKVAPECIRQAHIVACPDGQVIRL